MKRVLLSLLVVAMLGAASTAQAAPWNRRHLGHAPQPHYGHYGPPAAFRGPAVAYGRHHDPHCYPRRHQGFYAPYRFGYHAPGFSLSFGSY